MVKITNVQEAYDLLRNKVENVATDKGWLEYLAFQARFPKYSFRNVLLIRAQNPDARYVQGYNAWRKLDRFVKKGEKALRIFAPCSYKEKDEETGEEKTVIRSFRLVSVFDLSQTGGKELDLPTLVSGIQNDKADYESLFNGFVGMVDIPIRISKADSSNGGSKGYYIPNTPSIVIKRNSYTQMLKTMFHEYAHHIHFIKHGGKDSGSATQEVIAESVAFITARHFGIDTSEYSTQYIHGWSQGKKPDDIQTLGGTIQRIARSVIKQFSQEGGTETKISA